MVVKNYGGGGVGVGGTAPAGPLGSAVAWIPSPVETLPARPPGVSPYPRWLDARSSSEYQASAIGAEWMQNTTLSVPKYLSFLFPEKIIQTII